MGRIAKLYSTYLANYISRGGLAFQKTMSELSIKAVYSYIMTQSSVSKVFVIDKIPLEYKTNLSEYIRDQMRKIYPDAKITIVMASKRVITSAGRESYNRQYLKAEERYKEFEEIFRVLDPGQRARGVNLGKGMWFRPTEKEFDRRKSRYLSFKYVSEHTTHGGVFFRVNVFVQVTCNTVEKVDIAAESLETLLKGNSMEFLQLGMGTSEYLKQYGPSGYPEEERRDMTPMLMSEENMGFMLPTTTRGLIGGRGILFGIDLLSRLPLMLNPFESSAAQVMLILGKAGSGKTMLAALLGVSFAAWDVHVSILDYKGNEHNKIAFAVTPLEIDLSGINAYTNILRMDDLPVDDSDCLLMYNLTVSSMVEKLLIIAKIGSRPERGDLESFFKLMVSQMISALPGFDKQNAATYAVTKSLREEQIVEFLTSNIDSQSVSHMREQYIRAVNNIKSYYLSSSRSGREMTLVDILNHKVVIYSLNKNTNPVLTTEDAIQIFDMQHLNRKKHYFRSKLGLHTVDFYEELTRVEENATNDDVNQEGKRLLLFISQVVTGARSDNVSVVLLCNNLDSLKSNMMKPIRNNITTLIVGKVTSENVDSLVEDFEGASIEPYLREIVSDATSKYENCFAIRFDNGKSVKNALFKAVPPPHMEEKLRQRDILTL